MICGGVRGAHDWSLLDKPEVALLHISVAQTGIGKLIWKRPYDESDKTRQPRATQGEIPCPKSDIGLSFSAARPLKIRQDPAAESGSLRNPISEIGHVF